jgi:hypothetical protein
MPHDFDPDPAEEAFASLVRDYPGADVYPAEAFRAGRHDGSR